MKNDKIKVYFKFMKTTTKLVKINSKVKILIYFLILTSTLIIGSAFFALFPTIILGSMRVAVIKTTQADVNLVTKIRNLLSSKPLLDLIVTPEYSLVSSSYNLNTPRIQANCTNNVCTLVNINNGENLINTINQIANLAKQYRVNIVLGTLPLEEPLETENINLKKPVYNSLLVINNKGIIVAKKLKTQGSDWCNPLTTGYQDNCIKFSEISALAKEKALNSSLPISLTTRSGRNFKIFTSICADISDQEMAQKAQNANADLFIWSTVNGDDALAYQTTLKIQSRSSFTWSSILANFRYLYITNLNAINSKGFLLSSDTDKNGLGIIPLNKAPFSSFVDNDNYLFGVITLPK